jgi:hypothetical protein
MPFTLAESRVSVHLSNRTNVALKYSVNILSRLRSVEIALVDVVIFRPSVESVNFTIGEVHAVGVDVVPGIVLLGLSSERLSVNSSRLI